MCVLRKKQKQKQKKKPKMERCMTATHWRGREHGERASTAPQQHFHFSNSVDCGNHTSQFQTLPLHAVTSANEHLQTGKADRK